MTVKNGGLGGSKVSSLAPSASLASAAGTRDLQEIILFKCDATVDSAVDLIMDQWFIIHDQSGVSHLIGPSAAK